MRKIALLSLCFAAMHVSTFAASSDVPLELWETSSENLNVVNVCDLTDQDLIEIMEGLRPEMAVEFSAGTALPTRFFLSGDLVNLIENEANVGHIEIKQTFYARYIQEELTLSSNLTEWKPYLEFITGTASVALRIQDGKPSIVIGAETNRND